jgi:RNA-directed DNA polymerase
VKDKTRVIDVDLQAYVDNVRHHLLLAKVAQRVRDPDILPVLQLILNASGKPGVPQGGVMSPWRSNLYLTAVDRRLERAKEVTRRGPYTDLESARFADELVLLVDASPQHDWLLKAVEQRLREALAVLPVTMNEAKSRIVDLATGESVGFLGFEFRRVRSRPGKWRAYYPPLLRKRTALLRKRKAMFRGYQSQPMDRVIYWIPPIVRGWVRYCAVGDASRCVGFIKDWVEKKVRRHLMRARKRRGFGWKRWSRRWLDEELGLVNDYRIQRPRRKALPAR